MRPFLLIPVNSVQNLRRGVFTTLKLVKSKQITIQVVGKNTISSCNIFFYC